MAIRRMRFACCMTKATNTRSKHVINILIAFPRQQWFSQCASMLTFIRTLPVLLFHFKVFGCCRLDCASQATAPYVTEWLCSRSDNIWWHISFYGVLLQWRSMCKVRNCAHSNMNLRHQYSSRMTFFVNIIWRATVL
jgi:hypothetical protein